MKFDLVISHVLMFWKSFQGFGLHDARIHTLNMCLKLNSILEFPEFCRTARENNMSLERTSLASSIFVDNCSWLEQPSHYSSDRLLFCTLARANIEPNHPILL
ncbi:hypothetical protein CsSME_00037794 [Camellia sinensis var. sinensis]